MSKDDFEVGYPHELIMSGILKAKRIIKSNNYTTKTKLIALLLLKQQEKLKEVNFIVDKTNISLSILKNVIQEKSLRNNIKGIQKNFMQLLDDFALRPTQPLLTKINEEFGFLLFLDIYINKLKNQKIISKEISELISKELPVNSSSHQGSIMLNLLNKEKISEEKTRLVVQILNNCSFNDIRIYFTHSLANQFVEFKGLFLFEHYKFLKEFMTENSKFFENEDLDDLSLEKMFQTSIFLCLIGYNSTLRIPHQEKINYLSDLVSKQIVIYEVESAFDTASTFKFRNRFRIKQYYVLILLILSLLVDIFWRIPLPPTISILGFEFTLSFKLPVFAFFALLISTIIFFKMINLKKNLIFHLQEKSF